MVYPCHYYRDGSWTALLLCTTTLLSLLSVAHPYSPSPITFDTLSNKHVLVVGGSGRVGGSVVTQLLKHGGRVTVGGTTLERFQESQARWRELFPDLRHAIDQNVDFVTVNREDVGSISSALSDKETFDLVVHTAGPFQGKVKTPNGVIAACVQDGVPYVDVCDDYCTASAAKTKYMQQAKDNGVPCIISTGCWPGVSSLMAKKLTRAALDQNPSLTPEDLTVNFSFFTAGSGGAGATLLVATFLILAEEALTIVNGRRKTVKAMRDYRKINFGNVVGNRDVAHMNLLETASIHDILDIGNITTLFGTAPNFWNTLLGVMAQLPSSLLSNEDIMSKLAVFSLPIVRVVDYFAGATNAMRVDVTSSTSTSTSSSTDGVYGSALYAHDNLEPCVGECVAAFAAAVLSKRVEAGVWFPEESLTEDEDTAAVLQLASVGAHTTEVESSESLTLSKEYVWGVVR